MTVFTDRQIELMKSIGECDTTINDNIARITRGTLCVRVCKINDENYSVFCTDDENNIQVECSDCCLDTAIKMAFNQYRDKSSVVRQTRQFISNAEDDLRKYLETAK